MRWNGINSKWCFEQKCESECSKKVFANSYCTLSYPGMIWSVILVALVFEKHLCRLTNNRSWRNIWEGWKSSIEIETGIDQGIVSSMYKTLSLEKVFIRSKTMSTEDEKNVTMNYQLLYKSISQGKWCFLLLISCELICVICYVSSILLGDCAKRNEARTMPRGRRMGLLCIQHCYCGVLKSVVLYRSLSLRVCSQNNFTNLRV